MASGIHQILKWREKQLLQGRHPSSNFYKPNTLTHQWEGGGDGDPRPANWRRQQVVKGPFCLRPWVEKAAMRRTGHGLTQIALNPAFKCPQGSLPTHDPKHWSITGNILEGVHASESQGCAESPLSIWPPQTGVLRESGKELGSPEDCTLQVVYKQTMNDHWTHHQPQKDRRATTWERVGHYPHGSPTKCPTEDPEYPRWLVEKRKGRKGHENDREVSLRTEGLVRDWAGRHPCKFPAHFQESTTCEGCTEVVSYTLNIHTNIPSRPSLQKPNP